MNNFNDKSYEVSIKNSNDTLTVHKNRLSDLVYLSIETNGTSNGGITLRSKEAVESLHFMLGQLLDK